MADKKISQLTGATTPLSGTEVLPIVQSGSTVKVSVDDLTAGKSVTAAKFIPTANTATGNGMYLPAGNTLGWSLNGVKRLELGPDGNAVYMNLSGAALSDLVQLYAEYASTTADFYLGVKNSGTLATRLKVAGAGDVTVSAGNLIIGTSGKGIDFSATASGSGTMTSELLDDYEEGTWTPAFSSSGLSGVTYGTFRGGTYTKVGDTVTAWFTLYTNGTFTKGSGAVTITGLPFTSAAIDAWSTGATFGNLTRWDANPPIAGRLDQSATTIVLYSNIRVTGGGVDPTVVDGGDMRSAVSENCNYVQGYITYKTT